MDFRNLIISLKDQSTLCIPQSKYRLNDETEGSTGFRAPQKLYSMAIASSPAGLVLAGPLFHLNKKKKFFVGFHQCFTAWQRKSSKCSSDFSHAFTSPRNSKLDIQGLETRPTHGMETGLTRAALLTITSRVRVADGVRWCTSHAESEAVTELKNRKVRSGSVVQSMKVLREPIQIAEKAKVKTFPRFAQIRSPLRSSTHCLRQWPYHSKIASYGPV